MTAPIPEFTAAELAEARRMNRALMWSPRFRAPGRGRKFLIQSSLFAWQMLAPHGVAAVRTAIRRVEWKGHTVSLRILRSDAPARGVYVDYHGGGWAIGNAAMDDRVNARIAAESGLAVVSVDYTLLPNITLPQMIEQCAAAADWVLEHAQEEFGASDIFIGGESAGAHLAACSVLRLKVRNDFTRLKGVVLFYGCFDLSGTPSARNAERHALVLHGPSIPSGLSRLVPGEPAVRQHPELSPLYADLSGLPPALVLVGSLDPLIDDSRLVAERWQAQSGNAQLVIVPEAPHAFNRLPTRMAARTNAFVRDWIGAKLAIGAARTAAE